MLLAGLAPAFTATGSAQTSSVHQLIAEANRPGICDRILGEKAGIDLSICDIGPGGVPLDRVRFRAVLRLDYFLVAPQGLLVAEKQLGTSIGSLADWEAALKQTIVKARESGFVGVKAAVAYERSLDFAAVDRADAALTAPRGSG